MLSSEFNQEMGALIRSIEAKVRQDPALMFTGESDALDYIERAIASLVSLHLSIQSLRRELD